jgi:hypothetical protein
MVRYACAFVLGLVVSTIGPGAASADDGFRCDTGRLVGTGDHMAEVRNKCGEPDSAGQRVEKRTRKEKVRRWIHGAAEEFTEEREIEVVLDEWVYDFGPRRFLQIVTFENGRVVFTETGRERGRKGS